MLSTIAGSTAALLSSLDNSGGCRVTISVSKTPATLIAVILLVAAFSSLAVAQTIDLSAVKGQVLDPQGKAIAGADVTLNNAQSGLTKSAKTDQNGEFSFRGLPITDNYTVKVQASGFQSAEQPKIVLRANQAAIVNFTMTVSGEKTQVTVYGTPGSVTVDTDQITTRFDVQKIENTPILNRKILDAAQLRLRFCSIVATKSASKSGAIPKHLFMGKP